MCAGSLTAGTSSSSQSPTDDEFETNMIVPGRILVKTIAGYRARAVPAQEGLSHIINFEDTYGSGPTGCQPTVPSCGASTPDVTKTVKASAAIVGAVPCCARIRSEGDAMARTTRAEDLVVVRTYVYRHEAEVGKAILDAHSIDAMIQADDLGG